MSVKKKSTQKNGVRQLRNGTWEATVELGRDGAGTRRREAVYGKTRNEALRRRAEAMGAARGSLDARDKTVEGLLREWLDEHVRKHNSLSTYRQRETVVRCHLLPRLRTTSGNPIKLRDLDPKAVRGVLARMEADRVGGATRHSAFAALYAALSYALQHELRDLQRLRARPQAEERI